MKKAIILILILVLLTGLAVSANAVSIAGYEVPMLVSTTTEDCLLYAFESAKELPEEAQNIFVEAEKTISGNMRYFFYLSTGEPCTVTLKVVDTNALVIKQYQGGRWNVVKHEVGKENTVVIKDISAGPVEIYNVRKILSRTADKQNAYAAAPLPVLISADSEDFVMYAIREADKLSGEALKDFKDSQSALKDAVPLDMLPRYFFYSDTSNPCTVVFRVGNMSEVVVKQWVESSWTELKSSIGESKNVTVENVAAGPMVIFVK